MKKSIFITLILSLLLVIFVGKSAAIPADKNYLVGNWDGKGGDNIAVRRGNEILRDTDWTGKTVSVLFGAGDSENQYLVGDWDGNGTDTL